MMSTEEKQPARRVASETAAARAREDEKLVGRFLAGEEAAFAQIVEHHRGPIFAVAQSYLRNAADAEEITQDTFLRAYRALDKFRGESSLATWLHRIASNLAKNRYWYFFRRQRHMTLSLDFPMGEDGDNTLGDLFASDDATPVQASTLNEFSKMTDESLQELEPYHRNILHLRNVSGLSYRDIAENLGIKEGTVKSRIARARERLRGLVFDACPDLAAQKDVAAWFEAERPRAVATRSGARGV
jgi:RNA polymerase sigma-70 factor (ECF subfamily)